MGYGIKCGKWVVKGRRVRKLDLCMLIIAVVCFGRYMYVFSFFSPYNQGVGEGCTLSPTMFFIFINGLIGEVKKEHH